MSSKFSLILKGSSFRVLQTLVSIVIGLLMMPFLLSMLGKEIYGLWIVISSIVASYYLLDLGFNQAVTRYVTKYIHKNDPTSANRVINSALIIYSLLGLLVFIISVVAAYFGAGGFMENEQHLDLAQTVLIISGLSLALEFPAKAFPGIISAYMRFDVIATVRFLKSIVDAIAIYLAVSSGYGIVAIALITFVTGIMSTLIYVRYSTSLFKDIKFSISLVDKETFKSIFHFSKWVFVVDFTAMVRDKMDIWFISFYLGLGVLPAYYVAVRLIEYALQFMQQATGLSGPIFTEYHVKGEVTALNRSFSLFMKANVILGITVLVGFYLVGYGFIENWMKGEVVTADAFLCLMILAIGRFMVYFSAHIQSMLMTINKHMLGAWVSIFESILSVLLCVLLIPKYHLMGASFAIAVPYIIGRLFVLPLLIRHHIEVDFISFFLRILFFALVSASFAYYISASFNGLKAINLFEIIVISLGVVFFQAVISLAIWSKNERVWIFDILKKKYIALRG